MDIELQKEGTNIKNKENKVGDEEEGFSSLLNNTTPLTPKNTNFNTLAGPSSNKDEIIINIANLVNRFGNKQNKTLM